MKARAHIVVTADGRGGSRLAVLRGEPPLLARRTGPRGADIGVHLVGGAAGPLGGDELELEVEVGPGAALRVATVAASIALPGATGRPSVLSVHATVGEGGRLDWLPEPLIAAAGCDHRAESTVELAAGARLVWREELVCGRHGEVGGDVGLDTSVRLGGRPLHRHELTVGPREPAWISPAVLGAARAFGSLLIVDPAWIDGPAPAPAHHTDATATAARMPLAGPAVLVSAVGAHAGPVRTALSALAPLCADHELRGSTHRREGTFSS